MTRTRLLERFEPRAPLTVLRAPLGFGKTTLLAQRWQSDPPGAGEAAAWITVDRDCQGAAAFWPRVLEVLAAAGLEVPTPEPAPSTRALVRRMLAHTGSEVTLVIDAFERITEDGVDEDLLDLLRVSANLHVIVSMRGHRRFPPHAYLDLDVTVIPADELLLTVEETTALFRAVGAGHLPDHEAGAIRADFGGWVGLTRALALAVRDGEVAREGLSRQEACTRIARDHLHQRLLPAVGAERAEVALVTSLLPPAPAEMAEVLGDAAAAAHLASLVVDGLVPTTSEGGAMTYQWPPAARRAMIAELESRRPDRARQLRIHLAQLYAAGGSPGPALLCARAAGDWALAVELVERFWRPLLVSRRDLLYETLATAPLDIVATSPRALAIRDFALTAFDDRVLDAVPELPTDAEALARLGDGADAAELLDTGILMLVALCRRGRFGAARDYCRRLEAIAAAAQGTHGADLAAELPGFYARIGMVHLLADDPVGARQPLEAAFASASNSPFTYVHRDAASKLAFALVLRGELRDAETWMRRHDRAPADPGWLQRLAVGPATATRILVSLDKLDLDGARASAARHVDDLDADESWAFTAYARAMLAVHAGDALGGLHDLGQARAAYPAWHPQGSLAHRLLARAEADLLLALGRANQARAALRAADQVHPSVRAAHARIELLAGRADAALALAAAALESPGRDRRSELEALVIQAVAHHRLGQQAAAAEALHHALRAARAEGALRPFRTVPRADLTAIARTLAPGAASLLDTPALQAHPDVFPERVELASPFRSGRRGWSRCRWWAPRRASRPARCRHRQRRPGRRPAP